MVYYINVVPIGFETHSRQQCILSKDYSWAGVNLNLVLYELWHENSGMRTLVNGNCGATHPFGSQTDANDS